MDIQRCTRGRPSLGPGGLPDGRALYDRPMCISYRSVALLAVLLGTGLFTAATPGVEVASAAAPAAASAAESESTHPRVRPIYGQAATSFTLTFTLRETPGHEGVLATDYSVLVTPLKPGASCAPPQPPPIESGAAGETVQISLPAPAGGWCRGTYAVTVFLQRGPYCPPPQEGGLPVPCPEFALQDLDTGGSGFTVGPAGTQPRMVAVPSLEGLSPREADRRLRRRHLRARYTALSNICAGLAPNGRIVMQLPAAGTRLPRGTRVLLQTSCG
jgi:PASTA domain